MSQKKKPLTGIPTENKLLSSDTRIEKSTEPSDTDLLEDPGDERLLVELPLDVLGRLDHALVAEPVLPGRRQRQHLALGVQIRHDVLHAEGAAYAHHYLSGTQSLPRGTRDYIFFFPLRQAVIWAKNGLIFCHGSRDLREFGFGTFRGEGHTLPMRIVVVLYRF